MNRNHNILLMIFLLLQLSLQAQNFITGIKSPASFPIASETTLVQIIYDAQEDSLIRISAELFQKDIEMVTGRKPSLSTAPGSSNIILVGTLDSKWIRQLIQSKKINPDGIRNKWEAYSIQLVNTPFTGVDKALVITGSDRRGTAFGLFELSRQMGVSPWYWWADVPVKKKKEIYFHSLKEITDAPKVKYRGIFINDEAPALSNWSREKFGGFNHKFYAKVFELMLRLKSNYLWPAMWGNAFYDDDPLNIKTADHYGIVIGTSHHEPLMRAHDEWRRYGNGKWNYDSNKLNLREFWRTGMQRATNEKIVSIGMRGDGDEPMSRETATALLERIVKDQREIIAEVTGKPANETPQLWALYKEVQDYYDKGMRVPDDVTLLLCDDNWGNIRKLPNLNEPKRKGGYGIYYHFDYVGGPRNYKWINTNNLARVWEQMNLAYRYGADRIWIVNVGDIKPMELPTSFFLDFAWNPERWNEDNIDSYFAHWALQQFGKEMATEIGKILKTYSLLSARRKPELLDAGTYHLLHYDEAYRVLNEWTDLRTRTEKINEVLSPEYRDAYYQLVLHPVKAFANLHEMYVYVAWNHFYAARKDIRTNDFAELVKHHYLQDSLITVEYHTMANGKWNHMMSQTHIGYTYWQQPPFNKMPDLKYIKDHKNYYPAEDTASLGARLLIPPSAKGNVFYELAGTVSMEAANWSKAINGKHIKWKKIPGIGKTGDGVTSFPVTSHSILSGSGPHLQYEFYSNSSGRADVQLYFSPTLNFHHNEGLQFAVSIDQEKPVIISLNKDDQTGIWNNWVANNIIIKKSEHLIKKPGKHVLKYWMISPAIILQKLVVDFGGLKPSSLGAPEIKKDQ